jgi:hypothetical protein
MSTQLDLELPPEWAAVQSAWQPVCAYLEGAGLDADTVYALSMATQELLENAVKYGAYPDAGKGKVRLTVSMRAKDISIEVENPIDDSPRVLDRVASALQLVREHASPFEAYVSRLKALAAQDFTPDGSRLGLARIAYEAHCLLDFFVSDRRHLTVCATYPR